MLALLLITAVSFFLTPNSSNLKPRKTAVFNLTEPTVTSTVAIQDGVLHIIYIIYKLLMREVSFDEESLSILYINALETMIRSINM